ncbi:DUF3450 domain-containing protein [Paraburkholderia sp. UCT31]|uniref:hypothetical protein n=1 Tax=Paraburkholderia sp. UCT31 TaxID=2615209 RepID=UPI0016552805|nr:hypothetical protein [Paraburkholderia sp. UCT31]MBC8737168.1 DUF3450 domain-containing protein [Paraburkholderia sp. UCT31]
MSASPPLPALDEAPAPADGSHARLNLSRQLKNLLLMRPVFELALRTRRGVDGETPFTGLDTSYLALALLDKVMSDCAFGSGPTHAELVDFLCVDVQRMKPALSDELAKKVASEVVETLHNMPNRSVRFEYEYFDAEAGEMCRHAFSLLQYGRGDDDVPRYSVTDEGQLVYLGMLDLGAEDMQVLMQKMLAELVSRGHVDKALEVSKQAFHQAGRYQAQLKERLRSAQRRPDTLNFEQDVQPVLTQSRTHIDSRQADEQRLIELLTQRLRDTFDASTRDRMLRLKEMVERENALHQNLLRVVVSAGEKFREANNSLFRARSRQILPDIEDTVLPSLLNLPVGQLADIADNELHVFAAVKRNKAFHLAHVIDLLCQRQEVAPVVDAGPPQLVEVPTFAPKFSQEDIDAGDRFLERFFAEHPLCDIEQLLNAAEDEGLSEEARQHMTFTCYRALAEDESTLPVTVRAEGRFDIPFARGSRLIFTSKKQ